CDFFIGHLFSPPLPAEVLDPLIQRRFLLPSAFAATHPERTLLLLDDEENMLRSLVRLFRRDGYKVLTAGTVREAFDLLASNTVHAAYEEYRVLGQGARAVTGHRADGAVGRYQPGHHHRGDQPRLDLPLPDQAVERRRAARSHRGGVPLARAPRRRRLPGLLS